jgi:hypothetical protein
MVYTPPACPSDANGLPQFGHDFAKRETWRPQAGQGNKLGFAVPLCRFDVVRTTTTAITPLTTTNPTSPTITSSATTLMTPPFIRP